MRLLGDRVKITRGCAPGLPLLIGQIVRLISAIPAAVLVSKDMAKIYAEIGIVITRVVEHLLEQIPKVLMRVIKLRNELSPADRMLETINHTQPPIA